MDYSVTFMATFCFMIRIEKSDFRCWEPIVIQIQNNVISELV